MTVPTDHEIALGLLMVGCAFFIGAVIYLSRPRRRKEDPPGGTPKRLSVLDDQGVAEWSEDHYRPQRAVTRLTKDDITWEI